MLFRSGGETRRERERLWVSPGPSRAVVSCWEAVLGLQENRPWDRPDRTAKEDGKKQEKLMDLCIEVPGVQSSWNKNLSVFFFVFSSSISNSPVDASFSSSWVCFVNGRLYVNMKNQDQGLLENRVGLAFI